MRYRVIDETMRGGRFGGRTGADGVLFEDDHIGVFIVAQEITDGSANDATTNDAYAFFCH